MSKFDFSGVRGCKPRWLQVVRVFATTVAALVFLNPGRLSAMPPPTPEMVRQYQADGSWKRRVEQAERIGNHRVDPWLVQDAQRRLRELSAARGVSLAEAPDVSAPPSAWRGMPTTGTPKMFILLIDFSDYPADPANTVSAVTSRTFGDGDGMQAAPYESLKSYYSRASYGKLTLGGNVLATYRPSYTRASMGASPTSTQRENLIKEALLFHQGQGHDFSQYDNNGDGKIEYFAVLWTGPDNGWANFWWAYQTSWSATASPVLNGKTLGKYVWQWVSNAAYPTRNAPHFDPKVLIHETGHALGLPDYYDYSTGVGPKGGVGRLDMMDGNWGDHNCFSKWLMDWITPTIYTTNATGVALGASGSFGDAAVVMNTNPGGSFGEFFMVQNRHRVQNDAGVNYPADGLLIWHVDSRLNSAGTNYLYDNSYTAHKLLRLMEADGLEEIETKSASANAGDYWINGKTFNSTSTPSTARYDGAITGMGVQNISVPGPTMTFDVTRVADSTPPTGQPGLPVGVTNLDTVSFTWTQGTAADPESGIAGYHLQVGTTPGGSDVFDGPVGNVLTRTLTGLGLHDGVPLYARVAAMNAAALDSAWSGNSAGVSVALPIFDGAVLDNANCTFKTLGPWTATSTTSFFGGSSAVSAVIGHNASTYLQTKVTGPGTVDFYWKVNSEAGFDFLSFSIDGITQAGRISGTTTFAKQTFTIPTGNHILRWTYAKDEMVAPTGDAAWLDYVLWSPTGNPVAVVSPATYTTLVGATRNFLATVTNFASNAAVNWTISNSGGTFSPTQTLSGGSTTLTAGATAGNYTVTATPVETPNIPGTASLTLVTPASVSVGVSGSLSTVSVNAPVTFTASVSPLSDTTVAWTKSGGTFGTQTGTTTAWSSGTAGTYTITATSIVATTRSGAATVTVVAAPSIASFTNSGPIAAGTAANLTAVFSNGTGSVDKSLGAIISNIPLSTGPLTGDTTYTLTVTNAAGTQITAQTTVVVVAAPATPIITTPAFATVGGSGLTASVPAQGNSTYAWTILGGTLTAGQGTRQITYAAGPNPGPLTLGCTVTNALGANSGPGSQTVTLVPPPATPVISAPTQAIPGATGLVATVPIQNGCTYVWTLAGGSLLSGQGTNSITFAAGTGTSLALSCTASNLAGTVSTLGTATVLLVEPTEVTLTPLAATVLSGRSLDLVGTTNQGSLNWTLPAGQGTLSLSNTASGMVNTFTAPSGLLSELSATVTVKNATNAAKSAMAVLTVKTLNVNGDTVIDLQDILALVQDWGTTSGRSRLSGGATVGDADLGLLLSGLGL